MRLGLIASLGVLVGLAGCAAGPAQGPAASTADAVAVAAAVSAYRVAQGLPPVAADPRLNQVASAQASAMAARGTLSHDVSGSLRDRLVAAGVRNVPAAENVGRGHLSTERALAAWRSSPGHERNLRLAEATGVGFARADGPGGPWYALVLAGDAMPGVVWRGSLSPGL